MINKSRYKKIVGSRSGSGAAAWSMIMYRPWSESGSDGWSGSWSGSVGRFMERSGSCSGDDLPKTGCIITVYIDEDL